MALEIQLRRGTAAAWTAANPVLAAGEPGAETDTGRVKVGDGTSAWAALGYLAEKPTTGTGFKHTTAGVLDPASKLVEDADVAAAAGIAWTKVSKAGAVPGDVGADASGAAATVAGDLTTHAGLATAHGSTNLNTASAIVQRDASGNFAAGTITANLTGNASGTAANVTGVVAVSNGGTGLSALTAGYIPYGNGTSALASDAGLSWDNANKGLHVGNPTYAPNANLGNNLFQVKSPSGIAYMTIGNGDVANSTAYIGGASSVLVFGSVTDAGATTEGMRIISGSVGIGTTGPAAKLAVNGGVHVGGDSDPGDNNLLVDGTATASSVTSTNDATIHGMTVGQGPLGAAGSVAVGYQAGLSNTTGVLTAVGQQAGYYNTAGALTAVGYEAGYSNTTGALTAVGYLAGYSNTTGILTAVGHAAGQNNTTGFLTAVGYQAGQSNTTGTLTAVGYAAGQNNTTGTVTAVGGAAGLNNTTGNLTAVGYAAGNNNTTGTLTAVGYMAGYNGSVALTALTNSTFLGANANASADALDNVMALGSGAQVTASNQVVIGNSSVTNVYLGSTSGAAKLHASQFVLSALNTAPASATATGTLGEIRIVNSYIYVCVATNTWRRAALTTWY